MNLLVRIKPDGRYLELYPEIDTNFPENGVRRWVAKSDFKQDGIDARIEFQEEKFIFKKVEFQSPEIITDAEAIEAVINQMLENQREQQINGTEGDETEDERKEPVPYDPKKISIRPVTWSISYIYELISKFKELDLSPDFQREFVWDYPRKSQLIESLLLGIPIPAFYFAQNKEGVFHVVDGLQRLTAIKEFLENRFNLRYMEYLKDFDGYWYAETDGEDAGVKKSKYLSRESQRTILGTQLHVNIIEAQSPLKLKYDVFRRLNVGGKPLNAQEIRNCLAEPHTRNLVNELAKSEVFREATGGSVKTTRMEAQELVMRFICFWHERVLRDGRWVYKGNMKTYLDEGNQLLNDDGEKNHSLIRRDFRQAMLNSKHLFGKYAFRKYYPDELIADSRLQLINKSLFTTWSVLLSGQDPDKVAEEIPSGGIASLLANSLFNDGLFYAAVSFRTNDVQFLNLAFEKTNALIQKHILPL